MTKYFVFGIIAILILCALSSFIREEPIDKIKLGRLLFFDPILSKDKTISCASCHKPAFAFADTSALSKGINGKLGSRNTPSAMNLTITQAYFWDGRAQSLEEQALHPIANPIEMGLPIVEAIERLKNDQLYSAYFREIYNGEPTALTLADAIAAFERSLETFDSPFDNWKFSDRADVVSDAVKRGFAVFNGRGKCAQCHFGSDFTLREFRNVGLFNGKELSDSGRSIISGNPGDVGKFKTPGLRNITITAPYMHNGMFKTLREVIEFYDDPGKVVTNAINRDTILSRPLKLTEAEKLDLEAFLLSLTDKRFSK